MAQQGLIVSFIHYKVSFQNDEPTNQPPKLTLNNLIKLKKKRIVKYDCVLDLIFFLPYPLQGGAIAVLCGMERPTYFKGVVLIAPALIASPDAISPIKVSHLVIRAQIS